MWQATMHICWEYVKSSWEVLDEGCWMASSGGCYNCDSTVMICRVSLMSLLAGFLHQAVPCLFKAVFKSRTLFQADVWWMWVSMLSVKVVKLGDLVAERGQSISETTDTGKSQQSWRELSPISSHFPSAARVLLNLVVESLPYWFSSFNLFSIFFPSLAFHKSQLKEH